MKPPHEEEMAAHFRRRAVKKKKKKKDQILFAPLSFDSVFKKQRYYIKAGRCGRDVKNKKTNYIFRVIRSREPRFFFFHFPEVFSIPLMTEYR